MAWGSDTAMTQLTTVSDTEQFFTTLITLNPREIAHLQADINFAGTTDDMICSVYTTLDASTEVWDDTPLFDFLIDKDTDPHQVSFTVGPGIYKFRIGMKSTGATDDHTSADVSYRVDGVSA